MLRVQQKKDGGYPFGIVHTAQYENGKYYFKKDYSYRNQQEHDSLKQKIDLLCEFPHPNILNIKKTQETPGSYHLYYDYVPISLADFCSESDGETLRALHRQLIQLVIHLAKNSILTSFHPGSCGVCLVEGKKMVKYFLSFNDFNISSSIPILQRSVQIFDVQCINFLYSLNDTLELAGMDVREVSSGSSQKYRRSSQEISSVIKERKFSSGAFFNISKRKFSSRSKGDTEYSGKKSLKSTTWNSSQRKTLMKSTFESERIHKKKIVFEMTQRIDILDKVTVAKARSIEALERFRELKSIYYGYIRIHKMLRENPELSNNDKP